MIDPTRYSITVRRAIVDGELIWRASVTELPDLAEYGEDAHSAYDAALEAIKDLYAAAQAEGLPFPEPAADVEEYSGRITLRMPPSLHAKAAGFADREATSLNQYLCLVLSSTIGAAAEPAQVWVKGASWVAERNLAWRVVAVEGHAPITAFAASSAGTPLKLRGVRGVVNTTSGPFADDADVIVTKISELPIARTRRRATGS
jgi:predicted HicB family RNase H-like nuclease